MMIFICCFIISVVQEKRTYFEEIELLLFFQFTCILYFFLFCAIAFPLPSCIFFCKTYSDIAVLPSHCLLGRGDDLKVRIPVVWLVWEPIEQTFTLLSSISVILPQTTGTVFVQVTEVYVWENNVNDDLSGREVRCLSGEGEDFGATAVEAVDISAWTATLFVGVLDLELHPHQLSIMGRCSDKMKPVPVGAY